MKYSAGSSSRKPTKIQWQCGCFVKITADDWQADFCLDHSNVVKIDMKGILQVKQS